MMVEITTGHVPRRKLLGAVGTGSLAAAGTAFSARAAAPESRIASPLYHRFQLGEAEVTVLSDGFIVGGDPKRTFVGAPPDEIGSMLAGSFLETGRLVLDENVVVLNTGSSMILFDTGCGPLRALGPDSGRFFGNLAAAGINPGDVDAVVLTHGHADHICGAVEDGRIRFENARFYINRVDHDFWLDPAKSGTQLALFHEQAKLNLLPLRDRLTFIEDGQEILTGVHAMLTPGHTLGHMSFMLTSGGKTLALIADAARHHVLNVETPRLQFLGDIDPLQCVETRIRLFDMLVQGRTPLLSYHFPFPGFGHLARWGDRFRYYPSGLAAAL